MISIFFKKSLFNNKINLPILATIGSYYNSKYSRSTAVQKPLLDNVGIRGDLRDQLT